MVDMYSKFDDSEQRLRGYLFGTACGDALERPVEHLTLEQIKKSMGRRGFLKSRLILSGLMIPS
jgi:ADP-ribosylglycohydrolase